MDRSGLSMRVIDSDKEGQWFTWDHSPQYQVYIEPLIAYIPRVPRCLSHHWNWDPPPPLPQASVLPAETKGGGRGGFQFQRLERKLSTLSTLHRATAKRANLILQSVLLHDLSNRIKRDSKKRFAIWVSCCCANYFPLFQGPLFISRQKFAEFLF